MITVYHLHNNTLRVVSFLEVQHVISRAEIPLTAHCHALCSNLSRRWLLLYRILLTLQLLHSSRHRHYIRLIVATVSSVH
jgi:hypothetical protein